MPRAYGNGLDLAQATGFVRAYLERDVAGARQFAGDLFEALLMEDVK